MTIYFADHRISDPVAYEIALSKAATAGMQRRNGHYHRGVPCEDTTLHTWFSPSDVACIAQQLFAEYEL